MREGSRHCRLKLKHFLPFRMSAHCDVGDVFHQVVCAILNDVATATCHAKGKTSPSCPNITLQKRMTWAPSLGAAFVFLVVCFISICLYILRRVDDISYYIIAPWKRYQDVNMCKAQPFTWKRALPVKADKGSHSQPISSNEGQNGCFCGHLCNIGSEKRWRR